MPSLRVITRITPSGIPIRYAMAVDTSVIYSVSSVPCKSSCESCANSCRSFCFHLLSLYALLFKVLPCAQARFQIVRQLNGQLPILPLADGADLCG